MGRFVPAAADPTPLLTVASLVVSRKTVVALAAIVALSLVHTQGLGPGRFVQNALAGVKVAALLVFVALGFAIGHGSTTPAAASGTIAPTGMLLALIPIMFTYSGWNAAAYVAEEVRSPERNVPLALGLGNTRGRGHLSGRTCCTYALPVAELAERRAAD